LKFTTTTFSWISREFLTENNWNRMVRF
jgi:hypothetical protein